MADTPGIPRRVRILSSSAWSRVSRGTVVTRGRVGGSPAAIGGAVVGVGTGSCEADDAEDGALDATAADDVGPAAA